jgi:hypothetical protein
MKLIALVKARLAHQNLELSRWLRDSAVPALIRAGAVERCVLNVADAEAPEPPYYLAVLEMWSEGLSTELAEAVRQSMSAGHADVSVYRANENVPKGASPGTDAVAPHGVNLMAVWDGKPGLSAAELQRHWQEHIPLAVAIHHGADRYVQSWLAEPLTADAPPHRGVASLRFANLAAIAGGLFRNAEDVQFITNDVAEFIQTTHVMYTTEQVFAAV